MNCPGIPDSRPGGCCKICNCCRGCFFVPQMQTVVIQLASDNKNRPLKRAYSAHCTAWRGLLFVKIRQGKTQEPKTCNNQRHKIGSAIHALRLTQLSIMTNGRGRRAPQNGHKILARMQRSGSSNLHARKNVFSLSSQGLSQGLLIDIDLYIIIKIIATWLQCGCK